MAGCYTDINDQSSCCLPLVGVQQWLDEAIAALLVSLLQLCSCSR